MRIEDVIRRPLLTEKSTVIEGTYAFEVARDANKVEVQ